VYLPCLLHTLEVHCYSRSELSGPYSSYAGPIGAAAGLWNAGVKGNVRLATRMLSYSCVVTYALNK
jgi:hypothetical protein